MPSKAKLPIPQSMADMPRLVRDIELELDRKGISQGGGGGGGGTSNVQTFLDLTDTPSTAGTNGQILQWDENGNLENVALAAGTSAALTRRSVTVSYSGINSRETITNRVVRSQEAPSRGWTGRTDVYDIDPRHAALSTAARQRDFTWQTTTSVEVDWQSPPPEHWTARNTVSGTIAYNTFFAARIGDVLVNTNANPLTGTLPTGIPSSVTGAGVFRITKTGANQVTVFTGAARGGGRDSYTHTSTFSYNIQAQDFASFRALGSGSRIPATEEMLYNLELKDSTGTVLVDITFTASELRATTSLAGFVDLQGGGLRKKFLFRDSAGDITEHDLVVTPQNVGGQGNQVAVGITDWDDALFGAITLDLEEIGVTGGGGSGGGSGSPDTGAQIVTKLEAQPAGSRLSYNFLDDRPSLFSGNYNDLTNKPSIPSIAGLATTSSIEDAALTANTTTRWAKDKLPTDVAYDADIPDVSGFLTSLPTTLSSYPAGLHKQTDQNIELNVGSNARSQTIRFGRQDQTNDARFTWNESSDRFQVDEGTGTLYGIMHHGLFGTYENNAFSGGLAELTASNVQDDDLLLIADASSGDLMKIRRDSITNGKQDVTADLTALLDLFTDSKAPDNDRTVVALTEDTGNPTTLRVVQNFDQLTDGPGAITNGRGKLIGVNSIGTQLEYVDKTAVSLDYEVMPTTTPMIATTEEYDAFTGLAVTTAMSAAQTVPAVTQVHRSVDTDVLMRFDITQRNGVNLTNPLTNLGTIFKTPWDAASVSTTTPFDTIGGGQFNEGGQLVSYQIQVFKTAANMATFQLVVPPGGTATSITIKGKAYRLDGNMAPAGFSSNFQDFGIAIPQTGDEVWEFKVGASGRSEGTAFIKVSDLRGLQPLADGRSALSPRPRLNTEYFEINWIRQRQLRVARNANYKLLLTMPSDASIEVRRWGVTGNAVNVPTEPEIPAWTASTDYTVGKLARNGTTPYMCIADHTSGSTFAVGSNWRAL